MAKDNETQWIIQTGYTTDCAHPTVQHKLAQWTDDTGQRREAQNRNPPGSGDHRYEVYCTGSKWQFKYDGVAWVDSLWYGPSQNATWLGENVQFSGEVVPDKAVQMMGTPDSHVRFSGMQELCPGCTGWVTVWPEIYRNDDEDQWTQLVSQTNGYLEIYDTTGYQ